MCISYQVMGVRGKGRSERPFPPISLCRRCDVELGKLDNSQMRQSSTGLIYLYCYSCRELAVPESD